MIVTYEPSNRHRFAVLICECGEATWLGGFLSKRACRKCRRRWTTGSGSASRLAAAQALVRLRFTQEVLTKLWDPRDKNVAEVTRDVFRLLLGRP